MRILHYGNDQRIVRAARVSHYKDEKLNKNDASLISYLIKEKHASPFEHCYLIITDYSKNWAKEFFKKIKETNNPSLINTIYETKTTDDKEVIHINLRNIINLFFMKLLPKELEESFKNNFPGTYFICSFYKLKEDKEKIHNIIKEMDKNNEIPLSKEKNKYVDAKTIIEESVGNLGYITLVDKLETNSPMDLYTFLVECPIFVARQWFRHRFSSYNEVSRRYTHKDIHFYVPIKLRKQSKKDKQSSIEEIVENNEELVSYIKKIYSVIKELYDHMINENVSREQARSILPLSLITRFYWTVPFISLSNFIKLRTSEHAQKEIRLYAYAIKELTNYEEKSKKLEKIIKETYF